MTILPPDPDHLGRFTQAKQAAVYLVALQQNMELLWRCACDWEGFSGKDGQVVFSEGNPFVKKLNRTVAALWKARAQWERSGCLLTAITIEPLEEAEI